ncbi:MAG: DNA primase [Ignavibacteria bacterium]|jgi:DNA primase|nr:DNA primase [Ignavibacteria bacterium]MDH7528243.1 DNA primase [Ignavibacteria bacterium]
MKISDKSIKEVLLRADILTVVGNYVTLKPVGRNYFALCPFHKEKSPSFTVSPQKQVFHCFGCNAGGTVVDFLMKIENFSFPEAIEHLAKLFGIKIEYEGTSSFQQDEEIDKLYEYSLIASEYFVDKLFNTNEGKNALKYLKSRGINESTIKNFRLGYALSAWDGFVNFIRSNNYDFEIFEKLGIIIKKENGEYYDRFRGRIIFPVFSVTGRVIAFGGRIIIDDKDQPKYLNSPESKIYTKGKTLFGLYQTKDEIRKSQAAILVEGYMDFLSLYQSGIKNVVASAGTALTMDQIILLSRTSSNLYLVFDGDDAGQKAAIRAIELLLQTDVNFKIVALPEKEDPDSFIKNYGVDEFRKLIENGENYINYIYKLAERNNALSDINSKLKVVDSLIEFTAKVKDPVRRELLGREIASKFKLTSNSVLQKLDRVVKNYKKTEQRQEELNLEIETRKKDTTKYPELSPAERGMLKLICEVEYIYLEPIFSNLDENDFINPLAGEIFKVLKNYYLDSTAGEKINSLLILSQLEREELKSIFADALTERYKVSEGWEDIVQNNISDNYIEKTITDYIKKLKELSLTKRIEELMQKAISSIDYTEASQILEEVDKLIKEKKFYQESFEVKLIH